MKKILLMVAVLMMLVGPAYAEKLQIVTTSFPCYDFVRQVAGDTAEVSMMIQPGMDVHSYDPTPSSILRISEADLFVYVGGQSDVWADRILDSLGSDAPERLQLIQYVETHEDAHGHDHEEMVLDEHVWTSPKNAMKMVEAVRDALCTVSPETADIFQANADAYLQQIVELDVELTEIVSGGSRNVLVFADRFPFFYLAHDYALDYVAAFDTCAEESDPGMKKLAEMIDFICAEEIPVIYTIEMSSGNIAKMLAEETGAEILQMHSAQNVTRDEFEAGETYVSLMQKNLSAMQQGLN